MPSNHGMAHRLDWKAEGLVETWSWWDGAQARRICHDYTRPIPNPELGTAWSAWRDRPPMVWRQEGPIPVLAASPHHMAAQNLGPGCSLEHWLRT